MELKEFSVQRLREIEELLSDMKENALELAEELKCMSWAADSLSDSAVRYSKIADALQRLRIAMEKSKK